FCARTAGAY
nr:immunoglobulin heavy chain junction region [Mus musculus]